MILVFGSINLDTIYELEELPKPGQTVIGRSALVQPGGKGANQAVAAARDNAAVAMAGAVGQDATAVAALEGLVAGGVDLTRLARVNTVTGSAAICVDQAGQNQIAVASGANLQVTADLVAESDLSPGTTVVLQMEVPADENAALIRRARARGARIILNLAPARPIAADALALLDWLVVNEEEAAWLGGQLGVDPGPAALHQALGVGVVRTQGAHGVTAASAAETLFLPSVPIDAVDATAAGDCFIGVFATTLDRGADLASALRRANVAAALSCTRHGSQGSLPTASEIDAAFPSSPVPTRQPD